MKSLHYFVLFVIVFLFYIYIHNPVFSSFPNAGSIKFLYVIILFAFIVCTKRYVSLISLFRKEGIILLFILLFTILRTLVGGDPEFIYTSLVGFIEVFLLPLALIAVLSRYVPSESSYVRILLFVGTVGALISTLCIVIPSFGEFVKYSLIKIYMADEVMWTYRGYGISESLTGSYGYIQGAITALGILYISENKSFIAIIPFMLLSILYNARTGLIIVGLGVVLYFLLNHKFSQLFFSVIVIFILYGVISRLYSSLPLSDEMIKFSNDFFQEFRDMESGNIRSNSNTISTLFGRMLILPNDFSQWIIGQGIGLYGRANMSSDVGFVLQLNYGGLVYLSLLLLLLLETNKKMNKYGINRSFYYLFWVVFVICNIKSNYLINSGAYRLMMLSYYSLVFISYKSKGKVPEFK